MGEDFDYQFQWFVLIVSVMLNSVMQATLIGGWWGYFLKYPSPSAKNLENTLPQNFGKNFQKQGKNSEI